MSKFKVGDTVRVIQDVLMTFGYTGELFDDRKHVQFKGRVGKVTRIYDNDMFTVEFLNSGHHLGFRGDYLEKLDV